MVSNINKKFFVRVVASKRGFTLVETLVAISILLIGISAAFSAAQSGLSATNAVKDRITAIFLAQEAMEMVRNLKDSNILRQNSGTNTDWLAELASVAADPCYDNNPCDYDFDFGSVLDFISCDDSLTNNCKLSVDCQGRYFQDTPNYPPSSTCSIGSPSASILPSKFTRTINVAKNDSDPGGKKEAKITVTVSWPSHVSGSEQSFSVTENLFNWFEL